MSILVDATGEYIDHGSPASLDSLQTGAFTVMAWVHFAASGANQIIASYGANGSTREGWRLTIQANDAFAGVVDKVTADLSQLSANSTLTANAWNFLAFAFEDASNVGSNSVDGILWAGSPTSLATETSYAGGATNGSGAIDDNTATNTYVGNLNLSSFGFAADSSIANIHICNTRLTTAEVRAQQFGFTARSDSVLLCEYWGTGTQYDRSGNGNNGTVTNGTASLLHVPVWLRQGYEEDAPYVVAAGGGSSLIQIMQHYY